MLCVGQKGSPAFMNRKSEALPLDLRVRGSQGTVDDLLSLSYFGTANTDLYSQGSYHSHYPSSYHASKYLLDMAVKTPEVGK